MLACSCEKGVFSTGTNRTSRAAKIASYYGHLQQCWGAAVRKALLMCQPASHASHSMNLASHVSHKASQMSQSASQGTSQANQGASQARHEHMARPRKK